MSTFQIFIWDWDWDWDLNLNLGKEVGIQAWCARSLWFEILETSTYLGKCVFESDFY